MNGFSCTWEFRYTKYNKQGHEIEHKRDGRRRRSERAKNVLKTNKIKRRAMLEESLLKPTQRIKIFQAQCCAMKCSVCRCTWNFRLKLFLGTCRDEKTVGKGKSIARVCGGPQEIVVLLTSHLSFMWLERICSK